MVKGTKKNFVGELLDVETAFIRRGVVASVNNTTSGDIPIISSGAGGTNVFLKKLSAGTNVNFVSSDANEIVINAVSGTVIAVPNSYYVSTFGNDSNTGTSPSDPFLTINKAITEANLVGGDKQIVILSGTFTVDNSTSLAVTAQKISIEGVSRSNVVLNATTPGNPLLSLIGSSSIRSLTISGCTSSNALETNCANGIDIQVFDVFFDNNLNGISHSQNLAGEGHLNVVDCGSSNCERLIVFSNNGKGDVVHCDVELTSTGIEELDSTSNINIFNGRFDGCDKGVILRGESVLNACIFRECNTSVYVSGTPGVHLFSIMSEDSIDWDFDASTATGGSTTVVGGYTERTKINYDPSLGHKLAGIYVDKRLNDEALKVIAELHVGTVQLPKESAFGEGDSRVEDMTIFSASNGSVSFTDRTEQMNTKNGVSAPIFEDTSGVWYVGGQYKFTGLRIDVTNKWNLGAGGTWILEYGVNANPVTAAPAPNTWSSIGRIALNGYQFPFNFSARNAMHPYQVFVEPATGPLTRRVDIFGRDNSAEQYRFLSPPYWEKTTVNGVSAYWIRVRMLTPLTTIPTIERVKLGTNRMEINPDGTREFFGTAIMYEKIYFNLSIIRTSVLGNATDTTVSLDNNLSVGFVENTFNNNQRDGFGFVAYMPSGIECSYPIQIRIQVKLTTTSGAADKILMPIYYYYSDDNSIIRETSGAGTWPDLARVAYPVEANSDAVGGVNTTYTLPNATPNTKPITLSYILNFNDFRFDTSTIQSSDLFWLSLVRIGNDPTDTYGGDVVIYGLEGRYPNAIDGISQNSLDTLFLS